MANMLPAVFFGHGNPMNAVTRNGYTETWRRMGEDIPKPKAILSISAHWYVPRWASPSRQRRAPFMTSADSWSNSTSSIPGARRSRAGPPGSAAFGTAGREAR